MLIRVKKRKKTGDNTAGRIFFRALRFCLNLTRHLMKRKYLAEEC